MVVKSTLFLWAVFQILIPGSQSDSIPDEKYPGCPSTFFSIGEQRFSVVTERILKWTAARDFCKDLSPCGGDLAQPRDVKALVDYLIDNNYPSENGTQYWLGGSDLGKEGEWRWINNSLITTATGWRHGEPNDEYSYQHCLNMRPEWGGDNSLNDGFCDTQHPFICERQRCARQTGCPDGFFKVDGQCFKLLPAEHVTHHTSNGIRALPWPHIRCPMGGSTMEEAKFRCRDEGLILAQPTAESARALKKYMSTHYDGVAVWIGAWQLKKGSYVRWFEQEHSSNSSVGVNSDGLSSGIPVTSPLWRSGWGPEGRDRIEDRCVIMLRDSFSDIYQIASCADNVNRPLCQVFESTNN